MNANYDDPKYTAYVLGELDDAGRAAIEAELQTNSQAAALVAEIRTTTQRLSHALQAKPLPQLHQRQRAAVLAVAGDADAALSQAPVSTIVNRPRRLSWRGRIAAVTSLVIAGGLLIAVLLPAVNGSRESVRRSALATSSSLETLDDLDTKLTRGRSRDDVGRPGNVEDFDSNLSLIVEQDLKVHAAEREAIKKSVAGAEISFSNGPQKSKGDYAVEGLTDGTSKKNIVGYTIGKPVYPTHSAVVELPPQSGVQRYAVTADPRQNVYLRQGSSSEALPSDKQKSDAAGQRQAGRNQWGYYKDRQLGNKGLQANLPFGEIEDRPIAFPDEGEWKKLVERQQQLEEGRRLPFGGFDPAHNTEAYDHVADNPFLAAVENPLSTFSIDVDTASYSNIRRFLMQQNQRPPRGAVRIEELVNYFRYDYPQPEGDRPFSVTTEVASCPWQPEHRLVRIGLKGRELPEGKRPPSNLVFLIDVSGSMQPANKLPLVQQSLKMLAEQLGENDKVSIVVYAGNSGLVLPSTRGDYREAILEAVDRLQAGGSTNGGQGIELAYEIATNNLVKDGVNRVILATDGDFNVGVTNQDDLVRLIEEKAKTGVFLTTLGFGMGNIKDSTLEKLADKGNGNYAYIDDLAEARKVLVEEIGSTLVTIAKDVKIQVEFNPAEVAAYRLIGYENRLLAKEDFNDDTKDAGEIGAGHTVTALYEVVPAGEGSGFRVQGSGEESQLSVVSGQSPVEGQEKPFSGAANGPPAAVDALKYQNPAALSDAAKTGELFTLKLRYKQPDGDKSTLMETPVKDAGKKYREASADFKFAAAVASFGMILRDSPHKGNATLSAVEELAGEGVLKKDDKQQTDASYRAEFVELVKKAKTLIGP